MAVYLLGAGPGDPGLITVRGAEILRCADVVVYDRLAQFPGGILDLAPKEAEKIFVGKSPDGPRTSQSQINDLLIKLAKTHEVVVRLKGGDPFVFARGGEEAKALMDAGISFEVIPGITSPVAVPAYAGIPITLRHSSTSFTVITGHEDTATPESVDWSSAARLGGTLIILMGAARWEGIAEELLKGGLDKDTPAAAICLGTRPNQTTIRATLATLSDYELKAPVTIVVGKAAGENLSWFESRPLFGKKILITRAAAQARQLSSQLMLQGAQPLEVPFIEIRPPKDKGKALKAGLKNLNPGDWLVCTSPNGVRFLWDCLSDARDLGGLKIAAIGPGTSAAFQEKSINPDVVPEDFVAEGLLKAFPAPDSQGQKVLLARAAKARQVLPEGLAQAGYEVLEAEAYETFSLKPTKTQMLAVSDCDAVTFASPSAVDSFAAADLDPPKCIACIGPVTAQAVEKVGLAPDIVAEEYSISGLVQAIVQHFLRS